MGGELRVVAHFPHKDITINQFEEIESLAEKAVSA
jgi:hypothetical protein